MMTTLRRETPARTVLTIASRLPLGLLGMIALVAVAEPQLARIGSDMRSTEARSWRQTSQAATSPEALASDVLFLGDSSVKLGLSPQVFTEWSGLSAYNLALPAGQASAALFLLRRELEAGARPRALVIAFTPRLLMDDRWRAARFYAELTTVPELIELAWDARDLDFFTQQLAALCLPTYRSRGELRALVLHNFAGRWMSRNHGRVCAHHWRVNRGATMKPPVKQPVSLDAVSREALRRLVLPDPWRCERLSRIALGRLFALAGAHQVPVYWLLAPFQPPPAGPPRDDKLEALREQTLRNLQSRYRNLCVIDAREPGYSPDGFLDPVHLNVRGAARLSADLGMTLAAALARPPASRWVALETGSIPELAWLPEDVEASRAAVKAQWLARHAR